MWKLFDQLLDSVSAKLAENFTSNLDEVSENRAAREISEQNNRGRDAIRRQGSIYFWSDDIISDGVAAQFFSAQGPKKQCAEVALLA
jgi:hypothetical protein